MMREENSYPKVFGTILGERGTWKEHAFRIDINNIPILLSHNPQQFLHGCKYNIYGHLHNNLHTKPEMFIEEYEFLFDNPQYINVSVELTNYKPISFTEAKLIKLPSLLI